MAIDTCLSGSELAITGDWHRSSFTSPTISTCSISNKSTSSLTLGSRLHPSTSPPTDFCDILYTGSMIAFTSGLLIFGDKTLGSLHSTTRARTRNFKLSNKGLLVFKLMIGRRRSSLASELGEGLGRDEAADRQVREFRRRDSAS